MTVNVDLGQTLAEIPLIILISSYKQVILVFFKRLKHGLVWNILKWTDHTIDYTPVIFGTLRSQISCHVLRQSCGKSGPVYQISLKTFLS